MTERAWNYLCWVLTIALFALMGATGCTKRQMLSYQATISGVKVVDLAGRTVDPFELMETLQALVTYWGAAKISTEEAAWDALFYNPVVAYLPPTDYIQCAHSIDNAKGITCVGVSSAQDPNVSMFVVSADGEHLGCSSLVHELAHRLLLLQTGHGDGEHKRHVNIWRVGGVVDAVKLQVGCQYQPTTNLRKW